MKKPNTKFPQTFLAVTAFTSILFGQSGGTYSIPKSIVGSSGGMTTGKTLTLDTTVSEPVAGAASSGGVYSLGTGYAGETAAASGSPTPPIITGTITYGNVQAPATPPRYVRNVS